MDDMVDGVNANREVEGNKWSIFSVKIPKSKVVYFSQIVVIYIVVLTSLINLSIQENNHSLWSSLLSASIGYVLPAPQFHDEDDDTSDDVVLPRAAEQ